MRAWFRILFVLGSITIIPSAVYAQGSIAGIVKDASGAVLPGVTVEASSPALIEKTRSVVTDGTGQYKYLVDLRPGTYTVIFALPGFSTVKRDGIGLSGSFTATVNADLRVGAVEETITVSGETPIVDIQSTTRQQVLDHAVIDAIPSGRLIQNLGACSPASASQAVHPQRRRHAGCRGKQRQRRLPARIARRPGPRPANHDEWPLTDAVGWGEQYALRSEYGQHPGSDD